MLEKIVKTDPFARKEISVSFVRTVDDWIAQEAEKERFRRMLAEKIKDPDYLFSLVDDRTDRGVARMIDEVVLIAAYEIAKNHLKMEGDEFYLELGRRTVEEGIKSSTTMFKMSKVFTLGQIVKMIIKINPQYNDVVDMDVEKKRWRSAIITRKTRPEQVEKYRKVFGEDANTIMRNNCQITAGMLKAIPLLFKKKEATLRELNCEVEDGICRYELRWGVSAWERTERKQLVAQLTDYEQDLINMRSMMATMTAEIREQAMQMQMQELAGWKRDAMIGLQARVLAHDIKGPLTGADGYLQLMERLIEQMPDRQDKKMMISFLKQIARSVERAVELSGDISHYAKTGELHLYLKAIGAHYPLHQAMETFYGRAKKRDITLEEDFKYKGLMRADMRISTVFDNLIKNAMEAAPDGGHIKGTTDREGDHVLYYVEDNGPGIPLELRPNLFTQGATMGKRDGTGLGLYSANEIVKSHGGKIGYTSIPGHTRFIVTLPIVDDTEPKDSGEYLSPYI